MIENESDGLDELYRLRLHAIGDRIRTKRRAQDLTQVELAYRAEMSRPQLSNIEHGKNMNVTTLFRIADVLGVHPADLLDDRDR